MTTLITVGCTLPKHWKRIVTEQTNLDHRLATQLKQELPMEFRESYTFLFHIAYSPVLPHIASIHTSGKDKIPLDVRQRLYRVFPRVVSEMETSL